MKTKNYKSYIIFLFLLLFLLLFNVMKDRFENVYEIELNENLEKIIPTTGDGVRFFSGEYDLTDSIYFPTSMYIGLNSGEEFEGTMIIKNSVDSDLNIVVDIDDFVVFSENKEEVEEVLPIWEIRSMDNFKLGYGDLEFFRYTIKIPKNINENNVYMGVLKAVVVSEGGDNVFTLNYAIGVKFFIYLEENSEVHEYKNFIDEYIDDIFYNLLWFELRKFLAICLFFVSIVFVCKAIKCKS